MPSNHPHDRRVEALEARVAAVEETVAEIKEIVIPDPGPVEQPDSRDVPDPDGITPRQRWVALCNEVAVRDGITPDEANARLLAMPEFGGQGAEI